MVARPLTLGLRTSSEMEFISGSPIAQIQMRFTPMIATANLYAPTLPVGVKRWFTKAAKSHLARAR